tara:strand:+ start:1380 stop:2189 length:810 start_codon:yes stop_codon:yes gene_type:complete
VRVFAFGCSLSQYFFPTWADILIFQYKNNGYYGENWARSGAGNQFISTRLWEANTVHKFNESDVILLQWTSMFREDRYNIGKGWWTPGNFNFQDEKVFKDPIHAVMRDCALITSTTKALETLGCEVITTGFRDWQEGWTELPTEFTDRQFLELADVRAVLEQYKDELKLSTPPILNALNFGSDDEFFKSRPTSIPSADEKLKHLITPEVHPLTHEAAKFVDEHVEQLNDQTIDFVEEWKEKLNKDTIRLYELDWFNKDKCGWSDDRWRP